MNDDVRKQVSTLTLKLQSQRNIPSWALADEMLVYSMALKKIPNWGKKSRMVFFSIKLMSTLQLSDFVIFGIGLFRSLSLWLRVKGNRSDIPRTINTPRKIFAGFGASSEEYFYKKFVEQHFSTNFLRVNYLTGDGMNEIGLPNFFQIIKELFNLAFGYTDNIRKVKDHDLIRNVHDILTSSALNIGSYVFYRVYWRLAKSQGIDEVDFLAPDVAAFACVDENIRTAYTQHGLITLSVIIPKVNRINVLTTFEEAYFKKHLQHVEIFNTTARIQNISSKNHILMIVFPKFLIEKCLKTIASLVKWAIAVKLQIVFRPATSVTPHELNLMRVQYPMAIIDDFQNFFDDSYLQWNPKILAAWSSTCLAVSLDCGTLPVNLHDPIDLYMQPVNVMIYPMFNRALFWSRDAVIVHQAIESDEMYHKQVSTLHNYQDLCLS